MASTDEKFSRCERKREATQRLSYRPRGGTKATLQAPFHISNHFLHSWYGESPTRLGTARISAAGRFATHVEGALPYAPFLEIIYYQSAGDWVYSSTEWVNRNKTGIPGPCLAAGRISVLRHKT